MLKKSNSGLVRRLGIGFLIIDLLFVILLYASYTTAATIIKVEDPKHYLSSYATFTSVAFVAVIGTTTFLTLYFIKKFKKGISEITKAANAIKEGNIDITLDTSDKNEFGRLAEVFEEAIANTRKQAEVAQIVSTGNLDVNVIPRSERDVMGNALKIMLEQNSSSISNIKDAAYQVTTSSSQVASASETLAQGSTEQASAIEQITASIDDIAEKTKANALEANKAAGLMAQAIEDVKKGNVEMQKMIEAMQEINKASEGIYKIIKVIDDISFQTNILALNAAVEAARAGDAGKGFAVVAEEVRNLASKSSSAAAETAEMIESSMQTVEAGSKIAHTTEVALGEITEIVKQSEAIVHEIASASNYQATAIAQVDQAIEQVSHVVQTNSATSEECAAASNELSQQAARVRELVSVYKLADKYEIANGSMQSDSSFSYMAEENDHAISLESDFGKY